MPDDWRAAGFGLYVHWPFCQAKCPYCDFNSHVTANVDHKRWCAALVHDLERQAALIPNRVLNTIFFGGGTPSLMAPDTVARIIETARGLWPAANDMEITLEANPTSVEISRLAGFRDAGVNRISMGIQALNDPDLKRLGRLHTVAEARRAFDVARTCFDRVSFDLIYGRQDQSLSAWEQELAQALTMAADHLSLYQLTIEPGTAFGQRYDRGLLAGLPDEDQSADLYELTQVMCAAAGMPAYEVSNHARPGAESRHNLIYWRYGDYLGVGPGAHGRLSTPDARHATEALRQPGAWLNAAESARAKPTTSVALTAAEQAVEFLMMGLRLSEGVDLGRMDRLSDITLNRRNLEQLITDDFVALDGDTLAATPKGRPVLNALLRQLLAD